MYSTFHRFAALVALLLFVLPFGKLAAQAPAQQAPLKPTMDNSQQSLLWEITGNGIKSPSYIYGTIHIIPAEDYFMTEATKEAFAKAEEIVFEINMDDMMNPAAMFSIIPKAMMPAGKSLSDLLTEEEYAAVKAHFESKGLPMMMIDKMKPVFSSIMASTDMSEMGMGGMTGETDKKESATGMKSYEMEFFEMAKTADKKIGGLETIDFQISIFDSIPLEAQADMLYEGILAEQDSTATESQLDRMVELYKAQDIEGMISIMEAEEESLMDFDDLILNDRNANWIAPMKEKMAAGPVFFAVGAGHLGGPKGVLALLQKEGYVLKPVK